MKKLKLYIALIVILVILIFASVFVTVGLTDGREISDMTPRDKTIFIAFAAFFLAAVVLLLLFANRLGKLTRSNTAADISAAAKKSPYEKALQRRGFIIFAAAVALSIGLAGLGAVLKIVGAWAKAVLIAACLRPVVIGVVSFLLYKKKAGELNAYNAAERQNLFLEQRRSVEEKERKALKKLKTLVRCITALAVLLICLGAAVALLSGIAASEAVAAFLILYAAILIAGGLCRLFVGLPEKAIDRDDSFVKREEFPYLYSLAEKAAKEMGCGCRIRIAIILDNNIAVARVGDTVSLMLGVYLIGCLTDKELYAILLHEFSHIVQEANNRAESYDRRLQSGVPGNVLSAITNFIFSYPDFQYGLQYMLYSYAVSVTREAEADEAMLKCGDRSIAASALVKVYYLDRCDREDCTRDIESIWASEEPVSGVTQRTLADYKRRIAERGGFWSSLIPKEILARSATHPTLNMRLEALGADSLTPYFHEADADYVKEAEKAIRWYDEHSVEAVRPDYQKLRQRYYLDHIEKIEKWQAEGSPLTAEGYRGIVEALRAVGRYSEAEALCDRAMAELPSAASAFARFTKAKTLLHRYDPAGVELMYQAVEDNSNYIDEGLTEIGIFCCLTGDEEELARYRERSLELAQKQIDEYDQMDELKKTDRLSAEHLPDGKLEEILAYIASIDEGGEIKRVYLVRKTITESFFTSVFIIEFRDKGERDKQYEIMGKVFNYLDTESDWQYCLFETEDVKSAMPAVTAVEGSLVYSK